MHALKKLIEFSITKTLHEEFINIQVSPFRNLDRMMVQVSLTWPRFLLTPNV
jgi:hypothetical protein